MSENETGGSGWREHVERAIDEIQTGHEKARNGDIAGFGFHVGVAHSELRDALRTDSGQDGGPE